MQFINKFIILLFAVNVQFVMANKPVENNALAKISDDLNLFSYEFFKHLGEKYPDSNIFTSPLSLQIVMAMALTGASGRTAEEIRSVLKLPGDNKALLEDYTELLQQLKNPVLNIAVKMFVENSFDVKKGFNEKLIKYFKTDMDKLDFLNNSSASKDIINNWVEENTNKKIKDLISDGVLTCETVMVLINAIHFKANWKNTFNPHQTSCEKFFTSDSDSVDIQMMHLKKKLLFSENKDLDAKILKLPYQDEKFFMYIILPNQITGLASLEKKLSKITFSALTKNMYYLDVQVALPKFEVTQSIHLNEVLSNLGLKSIFSAETADFSGISDKKNIFVSDVLQKAYIKVDEEGTEAAVATAYMARMRRSLSEPVVFVADHPFLFFIVHSLSNSIIFIGHIYEPSISAHSVCQNRSPIDEL